MALIAPGLKNVSSVELISQPDHGLTGAAAATAADKEKVFIMIFVIAARKIP